MTSIRAKLVAILLLASALPLLVGLASVQYLGYRDFERNQGELFRVGALHLSQNLSEKTGAHFEKLSQWAALSQLGREVGAAREVSASQGAVWDKSWANYSPQSAPVRQFLNNDLAHQLRDFQARNPLFVEIFVTGTRGQIVGATNKTSDFLQADEAWWQCAARLNSGAACFDGIHYDQSAALHALEISLPIFQNQRRVGVLKAILNVSALFADVSFVLHESEVRRAVVLGDGRILARLGEPRYQPLSEKLALPAAFKAKTKAQNAGWIAASFGEEKRFAGFANLDWQVAGVDRAALQAVTPMTVIVSKDAAMVMAPVYRQLWVQGLSGLALLSAFLLGGLIVAQRMLVGPLGLLRGAAKSLANTAQLKNESSARAAQSKTHAMVAQLETIRTRDEIEDLARDFGTMARRVLGYHEQLETELRAQTSEIQRDLQMAREFQESLLPREYPDVSPSDLHGALNLSFHHVYLPAASVCGDFFDVFKVSEGRAGVFIADVMGHGARSALVTAILRTLLQDVAQNGDNPARLLEDVNRHFFKIMRDSGQFVFASAFYMVIDTVNKNVEFACAGHPAPISIDRTSYIVKPLLTEDFSDPEHSNAALGVDGDSTYTNHSRQVRAGAAFLLFTDGVSEAPGPDKEEFGVERLCHSLRRQLPRPIARLCRGVCEDIHEWMDGVPSPDDICLVGVELNPPPTLAGVETEALKNAQGEL